jgi:DNA-binding transcriptional LysR family regulator
VSPDLALFRYWRDGQGGVANMTFGNILQIGTIAAIRALVLQGEGVAVLPAYFVGPDIKARRLVRLFPKVKPLSDFFRLVFRADDPRRSIYERLAEVLVSEPLR